MVRLLIVEGNTAKGTEETRARGGLSYHERYAAVMEKLDARVTCRFAFPSETGRDALPAGSAFVEFDGAVWTGSPLHVYAEEPAVLNQLAFAEALYAAGVPVFGSCWGLQIMTRALGGRIRKNPRGREAGVAADLCLTAAGRMHHMYEGKEERFACFTVHLDEVEEPAPGTSILASNATSHVQAASIETGGGRFWGVQYHPEFNAADMDRIFGVIGNGLVEEGVYADSAAIEQMRERFRQGPNAYDRTELKNWLASLER